MRSGLDTLPVELLYKIQLYALSEALPISSRRLIDVFKSTTPSYRAQYLFRLTWPRTRAFALSKALQFPLCTRDVIDKLHTTEMFMIAKNLPLELPKRLFKSLVPRVSPYIWTESDHPLPFLKYLCEIHPLDINSHGGYALTRAVHASHIPLIQFLLAHGADPSRKDNIAINVAIRRKDISLVRLLIEPGKEDKNKNKKRKVMDRIQTTKEMLKMAVKCDARDIVDYFLREKRVVPDMQTVRMMTPY